MQSILERTRKADLTFHKGGRINISAHVSKLLSLTHGDVIDIMCGGGEVYLYVRHRAPLIGRHEGMVFRSNKNGGHYVASSIRLCRWILLHCGAKGQDKVRLCVGEPAKQREYGTLLPILFKLIL